jgi:hypothetical protein
MYKKLELIEGMKGKCSRNLSMNIPRSSKATYELNLCVSNPYNMTFNFVSYTFEINP